MKAQKEINKAEWENPDNWTSGPWWLSVYFSHTDSRAIVPKRIPWMGWTLNLAKPAGVAWLIASILFTPALIILCFVPILGYDMLIKDTEPPRVVSTFPQNGSQDVDPAITEIWVTFNEEMMDGNWSWVYEDESAFPQIIGQAYYTENNTTNILPVKLEPNKAYVIWINASNFNNFRDKSGNSAVPFKFTFKTR